MVLKQELGEGEIARWLAEDGFKEPRVCAPSSIAKMLLAAWGKMKLIELQTKTIDEIAESGYRMNCSDCRLAN